MRERVHNSPNLIYSPGTQVITIRPVQGSGGRIAHPSGAVGVIIKSPPDRLHAYRVRFTDGFEAALHHDDLKLLAEHLQGFAATQWKLFRKETPSRVKPLLYVYRVLLTGIHLMQTGQIEANLVRLNQSARLSFVDDLIALKLAGPEKAHLGTADIVFHEAEYQWLVGALEQASAESRLPELPAGKEALNDLLVRLRLKGISR